MKAEQHMHAERSRRLRGEILKLVEQNHRSQGARLDDAILWSALTKLLWNDLGRNEVLSTLQDLRDRKYLGFTQERDQWTGAVRISAIEITPGGRDLVEGAGKDAGVLLL